MLSEVLQNVKNTRIVFESLKRDYEQALSILNRPNFNLDFDKDLNKAKAPIIQSVLYKIEDGLNDSEVIFIHYYYLKVLIIFQKYMEYVEAEFTKMKLHNERLIQETTWLRDELKCTQEKLVVDLC